MGRPQCSHTGGSRGVTRAWQLAQKQEPNCSQITQRRGNKRSSVARANTARPLRMAPPGDRSDAPGEEDNGVLSYMGRGR